jgi:hypothetical protein
MIDEGCINKDIGLINQEELRSGPQIARLTKSGLLLLTIKKHEKAICKQTEHATNGAN